LIFEEPVHYIDLFCWYLGIPKEVYAVANSTNNFFDFEDSLLLSTEHEDNVVGSLFFSMAGFGYEFSIEVVGTGGATRGYTVGGHFLWSPEAKESRLLYKPKSGELQEIKIDGNVGELWDLKREIQLWIKCIKKDKNPVVTGEMGKATIAVCEAAEKSVKTGKPVRLADLA